MIFRWKQRPFPSRAERNFGDMDRTLRVHRQNCLKGAEEVKLPIFASLVNKPHEAFDVWRSVRES